MPGPSTTRKRQLSGPTAVGKYTILRNWDNRLLTNNSKRVSYPGRQVTVSEGHQWPPPRRTKARNYAPDLIDRGGSFYTIKSRVLSPTNMPVTKLESYNANLDWSEKYLGPLIPVIPGFGTAGISYSAPDLSSSDAALDAKGATAVSRCKPTNSIADASTFLGELVKEGLPSLVGASTWKNRTSVAKAAKASGNEYLNVQFGWAPIVSEVKKFALAVRKADSVIAQYERDAGRLVRRRYAFPIERSETTTTVLNNTGLDFSDICSLVAQLGSGKVTLKRVIERSVWFSGAFTYHLPSGYESRNGMARLAAQADKLFGINLTPDTLWNLAPWSWAIDWFSNTGDVISNLEDFKLYGLIMPYGYIMEKTTITDTYTHVFDVANANRPVVSPLIFQTEIKKRRPANPFGFGVSWEGLSAFQLSIAAALGISRSR